MGTATGLRTGTASDVYREQLGQNPASYSATPNADSDDFRFNAITQGTPARTSHVSDGTAYATQPTADSWDRRYHCDYSSPARVGTSGWNCNPGQTP